MDDEMTNALVVLVENNELEGVNFVVQIVDGDLLEPGSILYYPNGLKKPAMPADTVLEFLQQVAVNTWHVRAVTGTWLLRMIVHQGSVFTVSEITDTGLPSEAYARQRYSEFLHALTAEQRMESAMLYGPNGEEILIHQGPSAIGGMEDQPRHLRKAVNRKPLEFKAPKDMND